MGSLVLRTYRTRVDPNRIEDYETFERTSGLAMVRSMPGCLAAGFGRVGEARQPTYVFYSLWTSRQHADEARATQRWKDVASKLGQQGLSLGGDVAEHVELVAWDPDPRKR